MSFDPERHELRLPFPVTDARGVVEVVDKASGEVLETLIAPRGLDAAIEAARATTPITAVRRLTSSYGITRWTVVTPEGERRFEVPDRDLIRSFPGGRVFVRDADNRRWEIEDLSRLDPASRERVEREL